MQCPWGDGSIPYRLQKCLREFPGSLAVKDSVLSPLWRGFNPWPANKIKQRKKKKKKKKKKKEMRPFIALEETILEYPTSFSFVTTKLVTEILSILE